MLLRSPLASLVLLPFLCTAEVLQYMHPQFPSIFKREEFPKMTFQRGLRKVRDLPESGIVYLKRIRPIEEDAGLALLTQPEKKIQQLPVGLPPKEFLSKQFGTATATAASLPFILPMEESGRKRQTKEEKKRSATVAELAREAGIKIVRRKKIRREKKSYEKMNKKAKRNDYSPRVMKTKPRKAMRLVTLNGTAQTDRLMKRVAGFVNSRQEGGSLSFSRFSSHNSAYDPWERITSNQKTSILYY